MRRAMAVGVPAAALVVAVMALAVTFGARSGAPTVAAPTDMASSDGITRVTDDSRADVLAGQLALSYYENLRAESVQRYGDVLSSAEVANPSAEQRAAWSEQRAVDRIMSEENPGATALEALRRQVASGAVSPDDLTPALARAVTSGEGD